ncbi:MAG: NRAMP family divalent metal transporter [Syntrophothermus sp.]
MSEKKTAIGLKNFGKRLGPGIITGASDDDPSAIATFVQSGAAFGYGLLWTMLFSLPLKAVVQEISGRIGRVTGRGLAGNMCFYYSPLFSYPIIGLMVIANLINIGADIAAMGSTVKLVAGGSAILYSAILAFISLLLQAWIPYTKYVSVLKWLSLFLFSYLAAAFLVDIKWREVLLSTIIPVITLDLRFLTSIIGIIGATISPYLFFWQAAQEMEEVNTTESDLPLKKAPGQAKEQLDRIKIDTYLGMTFSNLIAFFIMITSAATLNAAGTTEVRSAAEAAESLKPLAGNFAFVLFSAGIIGTGLLAIPILAASAAYSIGEFMKWKVSLEEKPNRAKGFYVVIAVSILLGFILNLTPANPIKALFWAAVINGFITVPVIAIMMLISQNREIMGRFRITSFLRIIGWLLAGIIFLADLLTLYFLIL